MTEPATAADRGGGAALEFVLVAEAGILETQAVLLCKSIRRFAGAVARAPITVVSPRHARRPAPATLRRLERLDVDYLPVELDSPCAEYGPSFKVLAMAHAARRPGPPIVVQLDSDTLFLGEPDFSLEPGTVAARPVDVKGISSAGADDPFDAYWRALCRLCEVDYRGLPTVDTTVDRRTVRANYNGGLAAAERRSGVFERTSAYFHRLVAAKMSPYAGMDRPTGAPIGSGWISAEGMEYWGTSQAALSLAIAAENQTVRVLDKTYNYPLHLIGQLPPPAETPIHVHYHALFTAGEAASNPLLDGRVPLPPDTAEWLRGRLPLAAPPA
jgi:hypothetical protein